MSDVFHYDSYTFVCENAHLRFLVNLLKNIV